MNGAHIANVGKIHGLGGTIMRGMAYQFLVGISGWVKGKTYKTELSFGPDPGCVLVSPEDSAAAGQHASIYVRGGKEGCQRA
jgi:hypothetical protein